MNRARQSLVLAGFAVAAVAALIWLAFPRGAGSPDAAAVAVVPVPDPATETGERVSLASADAVPEGAHEPNEVSSPQPEAQRIEGQGIEAPPVVSEPTFPEKYAGKELGELQAALAQLISRQRQLVSQLARERHAQGQFRVEGPVPKDPGYVVETFMDHPLQHRPTLVVFGTEDVPGTDEITVEVVEVSPSDTPELRALRDEEVWLTHQIELLK